MKLFFTLFILLTSTIFASKIIRVDSPKVYESERLCQVFHEKKEAYKLQMRDDEYAKKTLASYEKRASFYCQQ